MTGIIHHRDTEAQRELGMKLAALGLETIQNPNSKIQNGLRAQPAPRLWG